MFFSAAFKIYLSSSEMTVTSHDETDYENVQSNKEYRMQVAYFTRYDVVVHSTITL